MRKSKYREALSQRKRAAETDSAALQYLDSPVLDFLLLTICFGYEKRPSLRFHSL